MATWSSIRSTLLAVIATCSGQPAKCTEWADGKQTFATDPKIRLSLLASTDTHTRLVESTTAGITTIGEVSQIVEFTLSVRVETLSNTGTTALDAIDRIPKALWLGSITDTLAAAEIVWYGNNPIQYIPYKIDDRSVCAYNLDLLMRAQVELASPGETIGTIEHVEIQGSVGPYVPPILTDVTVDKP